MLTKRIAHGGAAEVFLAKPSRGLAPAPALVIKCLRSEKSPHEAFELLSSEADLHQSVTHPNVVRVFGAGMIGNEPYLALEHVDGVNLHQLLQRLHAEGRQLEHPVAWHVVSSVVLALQAVHAKGIVHGDVTPSNILLSITGEVKLGDFGIAHATSRSLSGEGAEQAVKGKCGYVAPEVFAGDTYDHRADLFSLCVVLGELLIGQSIFPGEGPLARMLSIREGNLEPLDLQRQHLGGTLHALIAQGVAAAPEARYATAADLHAALQALPTAGAEDARVGLASWVAWAKDEDRLAQRLEQRVLQSAERLQLDGTPVNDVATTASQKPSLGPMDRPTLRPGQAGSTVRRDGVIYAEDVSFASLVEMVISGELSAEDEVALMGAAFRPLHQIEELARHLLPSTTAATGQMFDPGVPDFAAKFSQISPLRILAKMRVGRETGALFAHRETANGKARRDIYLSDGKLVFVASSAPEELLGEYLVRQRLIKQAELDVALAMMSDYGGRLGDTLIALKLVDPVNVYRAIRNQGRDRVASLCRWSKGEVQFYRGAEPGREHFKLDLDLSIPMMAGVILASEGNPALPPGVTGLQPGSRIPQSAETLELNGVPDSLKQVPELARQQRSIEDSLTHLTRAPESRARPVSPREATTALIVAEVLEWIRFVE